MFVIGELFCNQRLAEQVPVRQRNEKDRDEGDCRHADRHFQQIGCREPAAFIDKDAGGRLRGVEDGGVRRDGHDQAAEERIKPDLPGENNRQRNHDGIDGGYLRYAQSDKAGHGHKQE